MMLRFYQRINKGLTTNQILDFLKVHGIKKHGFIIFW